MIRSLPSSFPPSLKLWALTRHSRYGDDARTGKLWHSRGVGLLSLKNYFTNLGFAKMKMFQSFKIKKLFCLFLLKICCASYLHADFTHFLTTTLRTGQPILLYHVTGNGLKAQKDVFVDFCVNIFYRDNSCLPESVQACLFEPNLRNKFDEGYFNGGIFIAAYDMYFVCKGWAFFKKTEEEVLIFNMCCFFDHELGAHFILSPLFLQSLPRKNKIYVFCNSNDVINIRFYESIAPCEIVQLDGGDKVRIEYKINSFDWISSNISFFLQNLEWIKAGISVDFYVSNELRNFYALRRVFWQNEYKELKKLYYLDLRWINAFLSNIEKKLLYREIVKIDLAKKQIQQCNEAFNSLDRIILGC